MRHKIQIVFTSFILLIFTAQTHAIEYLYKFTGGTNYWANGDASGSLGSFQLANGVNGVNYQYNGSKLGFWVDAKSGVILLPNIKFRYQDIQFYGTGEILQILNIEVANIDLSNLIGDVESQIDFSYVELIASFNMPVEVVDFEAGLKIRLHAINYGIGLLGGQMQRNGFYAPIPFLYTGISKSFVDDNLSLHGEYAVLPINGVLFETTDVFFRYKLPIERISPIDLRVQAGFQSFNFTIDADSSFNFLTDDDGQFGFQSIVLGVTGAF